MLKLLKCRGQRRRNAARMSSVAVEVLEIRELKTNVAASPLEGQLAADSQQPAVTVNAPSADSLVANGNATPVASASDGRTVTAEWSCDAGPDAGPCHEVNPDTSELAEDVEEIEVWRRGQEDKFSYTLRSSDGTLETFEWKFDALQGKPGPTQTRDVEPVALETKTIVNSTIIDNWIESHDPVSDPESGDEDDPAEMHDSERVL